MKNEIFIDGDTVKQGKGLNKYDLLQSLNDEIKSMYNEVFEHTQGSLTIVSDNDATSKFKVAQSILDPTGIQTEVLDQFKNAFKSIEDQIDPDRLHFEIDKAADNEICIYRKSANGITNVIINDDGSIGFSFIAYKESNKIDLFDFYDIEDCKPIDYEALVFKFFSL